ncbi:MAG TPA: phosphate signaling complex protein PhoU [Actinomycetota bacterium]|jgi:phosphate transport system protein|nr:phosphate signaling complex protein PhoU [Actinomycetota bacterium]
MRKAFHEDLSEVESIIVMMAGQVVEQLEKVMRALDAADEDLASEVIAADDGIDRNYLEVRNRVLLLLATQAPVAVDLRHVSAMLHINIHLERMGDLCTTIAKAIKLSSELPRNDAVCQELLEMGAQAARLTESSIKAFTQRDLDLARSLPRLDDPIDRLNRGIIRAAIAEGADSETGFEWAARMVLVSRQLERLGDHAVDIGEEVAFLVTGEFAEFTDASHKKDGLAQPSSSS